MTRRSYEEVERDLIQPLDASRVKHRDAGRGRQVPYIEGYDAISRANEIFGFDGWSYCVKDVSVLTTTVGRLLYRAVVTVEALGVERTDVGVSIVEMRRDATEETPDAHDMALKGAVTDALKRGLRSFGAQFGNELYDKEGDHTAPQASERPANRAGPAQAANVGDFLAWAWKEHGLNKSAVLSLLKVETPQEITDLHAAAEVVKANGKKAANAQ